MIRQTGYRADDIALLFEEYCRMSAADAVRLLEETPELLAHLTEENLLPALQADDMEIRQRAMLLFSRVGESVTENDVPKVGAAGSVGSRQQT